MTYFDLTKPINQDFRLQNDPEWRSYETFVRRAVLPNVPEAERAAFARGVSLGYAGGSRRRPSWEGVE